MKKLKIYLGILAVFVVGAAFGFQADRFLIRKKVTKFVRRGPEAKQEMFLRKIDHELNLNEKQREEMMRIYGDMHKEIHDVLRQSKVEMREIIRTKKAEAKQYLDEEQAEKLDQFMAEISRPKHYMKPPRNGPPPRRMRHAPPEE